MSHMSLGASAEAKWLVGRSPLECVYLQCFLPRLAEGAHLSHGRFVRVICWLSFVRGLFGLWAKEEAESLDVH